MANVPYQHSIPQASVADDDVDDATNHTKKI